MAKIVLVANTAWSMIKFRKRLMQTLVEENHHVIVIAPYDSYRSQIEALGCEFIAISIDNSGANAISDFLLLNRLYRLYRTLQPDLIFHYTIKPNIYGTLAAYYAKIPSIAVVTGLGYTFINKSLTSWIAKELYRYALAHTKEVWFINNEDKKHFLKEKIVDSKKIVLLPGEGVDTRKFSPIPVEKQDDTFRFILIARLLWDKGVGEYVKAARELKKKYKEKVECQILGFVDVDNPQAITKDQVERWQEEGTIVYLGETDDVRNYISQADCVVLPSYREGMSMILMEAASMQKPLIASSVPGCKELVIEGENGYLCQPRDARDLCRKMQQLLNLPKDQHLMMAKAARAHIVQHFTDSIVVEIYLEHIEKILVSLPKMQTI